MVEHMFEQVRGIYHYQMKDVFEDGVFKRYTWVKTRKDWKAILELSPEGWYTVSTAGLKSKLQKDWSQYYLNSCVQMFDENTEPVKELFRAMEESLPQFKYWVKKLIDSGIKLFYVLGVLIEFKNIPETESLLIPYEWIQYREPVRGYPIFHYMNKSYWKREKPAMRKVIINKYRELLVNNQNGNVDFPWNWKEFVDMVTGKKPEEKEVVYGNGVTAVTRKDVDWLRKNGWVEGDDLKANEGIIREYHDFLTEIRAEVTDITDPYFRHKKNWRKLHQKRVKKLHWQHRLNGLRIFLDIPEKNYTRTKEVEVFKKRYAKYKDYILEKGNMRAYISNNIKQWEKRASTLRQCIMSCHYYAKTECVLVFIDIGGNPAYTAEITKGNRVGQFMGDERQNSLTCRPTQEARDMLNEFLSTYQIM